MSALSKDFRNIIFMLFFFCRYNQCFRIIILFKIVEHFYYSILHSFIHIFSSSYTFLCVGKFFYIATVILINSFLFVWKSGGKNIPMFVASNENCEANIWVGCFFNSHQVESRGVKGRETREAMTWGGEFYRPGKQRAKPDKQ